MVSIDGNWHDPAKSEANIEWVRTAWRELERHSTGAIYLNSVGDSGKGDVATQVAHSVYGASWDRLAEVKAK